MMRATQTASVLGLICSLTLSASAKVAQADDQPMISVGTGLAVLSPGAANTIEGYFRVHFSGANAEDKIADDLMIRAVFGRLQGQIAVGAGGPDYLDISLDTVSFERINTWDNGNSKYLVGATVLGGSVQRNVQIGENIYANISFLGFYTEVSGQIAPGVEAFAKAALDVVGLGVTQTLQNQVLTGITTGGALQAGLQIAKRIRITVGEKIAMFAGNNQVRKDLGTQTCYEQVDPTSGYSYENCSEDYKTIDGDARVLSSTSLELSVQLVEHLSVFGSANYNLYNQQIIRNETDLDGNQGSFQFFFGVEGEM